MVDFFHIFCQMLKIFFYIYFNKAIVFSDIMMSEHTDLHKSSFQAVNTFEVIFCGELENSHGWIKNIKQ